MTDQSTYPSPTQLALDKGVLVSWTKSFNCPGVVGQDAARLLTESLHKIDIRTKGGKRLTVKVVAILNDTTGTLVMGSYDNPHTCIGLILGTGANGAYFEQSKNVIRWSNTETESTRDSRSKNVIIDPEWGAFGDNGCVDFLKTEVDKEIDGASLFPGSFTYEKYFSGKYLGNILRLILWRLNKSGDFLSAVSTTRLGEADSLTAEDVSLMVTDLSHKSSDRTRAILGKVTTQSLSEIDERDLKTAQIASYVISERCSMLVAIPLAVFLERIDRGPEEVSAIAVTGSLYQKHPTIKDSLEKYTKKWTKNRSKIYTFLSEDGSGKGAALVAAIAAKIHG